MKHPKNDMFWYCYSEDVLKYLRDEKKIIYITKAKHEVTNKVFAMFFKDEVKTALDELKALKQN
ncbi:hypothetical protein H7S74_30310 [Priestia aryabhattai]|uniref:hypothetical protein n=1 Tax=Priestia aryabhattai TaxID=412384 RepID=UPI001EBA14E3|nr:hypothetical protein [Priestia aryabhattai]MBY0094923.1 hypothetical protein [Priestia aryabhattai]MBY0105589.1 hypothetical protein [Priestia aryabhattai]